MRGHTMQLWGKPSRKREYGDKPLRWDQQGTNKPEGTQGKVVRRQLLNSAAYWSPLGTPKHPDLIN